MSHCCNTGYPVPIPYAVNNTVTLPTPQAFVGPNPPQVIGAGSQYQISQYQNPPYVEIDPISTVIVLNPTSGNQWYNLKTEGIKEGRTIYLLNGTYNTSDVSAYICQNGFNETFIYPNDEGRGLLPGFAIPLVFSQGVWHHNFNQWD